MHSSLEYSEIRVPHFLSVLPLSLLATHPGADLASFASPHKWSDPFCFSRGPKFPIRHKSGGPQERRATRAEGHNYGGAAGGAGPVTASPGYWRVLPTPT